MDEDAPKAYAPMAPATSAQIKAGESAFARSKDLIAAGDKATARQIANVMGRWQTRTEWNEAGIGRKRQIDDYRAGDFFDEDLDKLATDFNKPMEHYIARRPQFMDFCERYGLVARWVHRENCGSLPFPDDEAGRALAASVGATVEELNAEAVDPIAADVLFDAIADTGLMGFAEEEAVDRKRASFLTASGGFNADAFGGAILRSRVNTAAAVSGVRVVPPTIFAGVGLAHLDDLKDMYEASRASFELNMATHPWTIAIPLCGIPLFARAMTFTPPRERSRDRTLNYQERAILERDEYYKERMKLKRAGKLEEEYTPKVDELFTNESYIEKVLSGKGLPRIGRAAQPATVGFDYEKRDDDPYAGMFDGLGSGGAKERELLRKESLTPQEQRLLEKVQIRPSTAKGGGKIVGQAIIVFWISLVPYVMIMQG